VADETREVEVKLNVGLGPGGDRALKTLEESSKRAGEALSRAAGTSAPFRPTQPRPATPPAAPSPGRGAGDIYGFADAPDRAGSKAALAASVRDLSDSAKKMATAAASPFRGMSLSGPDKAADKAKDKLSDDLAILRNLHLGGIAGRAGQFQGYGKGLHELGFEGLGGMLSKGALPLGIASAVGSTAFNATMTGAKIFQDPFATRAQMGRSFLRDVVPLGSTALDVHDTVTGRAAEMERASLAGQQLGVDARRRSELSSFQGSYNVQQAGRVSQATSFANTSAILPPMVDRTTGVGERMFREESRLYPLRVQGAKAERDAASAAKERLAADQELAKLGAREKNRLEERNRLAKELTAEESGPARVRVLDRIKANEEEIQATANLRRQAAATQMEARNRETGARADVLRVDAAKLAAQAQNVTERAATSANFARSLGMMNPIERARTAAYAGLYERHGLEAMPQDIKEHLAGMFPETIGKEAERIGAGSPEFAAVRAGKKFGGEITGAPEDLRREAAELTKREAEKRFEADHMVATTAADAGRDFAKLVVEAMRIMFDSMKKSLADDRLVARGHM
jgi:hypothetical protein